MMQIGRVLKVPTLGDHKAPATDELRKRARRELESEQTYYSLIALPLCMGEVAWDLIDTVMDICILYRVSELKRVTRLLKQMRKDYQYQYSKYGLKGEQTEPLQAWCESYMDETDGSFAITREIMQLISDRYPYLDKDWVCTVASAYLAWVYLKGIIKFTEAEERKFAKKLGLPNWGHMLPKEMYQAIPLVEAVAGDCALDTSLLDQYVDDIVGIMTDVAGNATEPVERTKYRHKCIAYICNQGCRQCAIEGKEFGCYPSSGCRRMERYDKRNQAG